MVPEGLQYTAEHEWVATAEDEGTVRVGITDYAQDQLGDVVFVQLPTAGETVSAGDSIAEVESTKSVSEIYAPLAGEITADQRLPGRHPRAAQLRPLRLGLDVRDAARPTRARSRSCSTPRLTRP